ncbi:uncharacterized protein JCM6883_005868 [Sporobolomyces salmoneus]|uniref:uncharacterized protein n=1 Tax=Sporobolomyces salmoneus TaxID=183962 RepID=UPI003172B5A9
MSTPTASGSSTPIASSSSRSSPRFGELDHPHDSTNKDPESIIDEHVVHDLLRHFFSNPCVPISPRALALISPHLTISLPYYPIAPPTLKELENSGSPPLEKTISAKSLALFHFPMIVNTLPRSAWTLKIGSISRLIPSHSRSLQLDPKLRNIEIWTAELQWTLRFGSIATTSGISSPSLAYQAGKPLGVTGEGGGFDDWVSVGEKRKVDLVFAEVGSEGGREDRAGEEKGKGKERRKHQGAEKKLQLIHLRLSLPPGSTTPAEPLALFPTPVHPVVSSLASKVIAPRFLNLAFTVLRLLDLDEATPRLRLPDSPSHESTKHTARSRSRTRHPHAKPSDEETKALEILREHSISPAASTSASSLLGRPSVSSSIRSLSKEAFLDLLMIPISIVSTLIIEFSSLYYLIARIVVLFTQFVIAAGGVLKDVFVSREEREEGVVGIGIGAREEAQREKTEGEGLERIREIEEEGEEEGMEEAVQTEFAEVTVLRGSPPLSPTPPVYHHPRLRGKRVSFPSLFATVIGSQQSMSSPQISLPPSPAHSPAPPPPGQPSSSLAAESPETLSLADETENFPPSESQFEAQVDLHSRIAHEAARAGSRFHSVLSLPNHGIDRGELGRVESELWPIVSKEASSIGKDMSTEVRVQVAVAETEEELVQKRGELIEKIWEGEVKEEGVLGGEEEEMVQRRRVKNRVGKEVAEVVKGKEEVIEGKLGEVERQIERRRKEVIKEALALETQMHGEGEEKIVDLIATHADTAISPTSSSSDYPTPSSRFSDAPIAESSTFEPASPTPEPSSSGSSTPSTIRRLESSPMVTQGEGGVVSPPTSPETSKKGAGQGTGAKQTEAGEGKGKKSRSRKKKGKK